jgi:tripartite-type tricarboxylate transporter receptor subunit TctC
MSAAIIQRIASEVLAAVGEPEVARQLVVVGVEPAGEGPEGFASVLHAETKRIDEVAKAAGLKAK